MYSSGTVLFGVMLLHGVLLVASGGPLNGPVSFRKAMTFAESLGLACWSVAWLLGYYRFGGVGNWLVAAWVSFFALVETAMFTVQVWRGVPSHYNFNTLFDGIIYIGSGVGAVIYTALIAVLLLRSGRLRETAAPSIRLAIRTGLLMTLIGSAVGVVMSANAGGVWEGVARFASNPYGEAMGGYIGQAEGTRGGNLVLLHALGIHGLQLIPLAAWLLSYSRWPEAQRYTLTALVAGLNFALMAAFAVPVFQAVPLSDFSPTMLGIIGAIGSALLASYAVIGYSVLYREAKSMTVTREAGYTSHALHNRP
ncbi:hypothetical protein HC891_10255 [Candidatus Gracilibacteria bacterium]|nr:hypothetical protein [Candidatus Gracilibacteria bacterium]